nr:hypothetical protein [Miltoncostaea marina]
MADDALDHRDRQTGHDEAADEAVAQVVRGEVAQPGRGAGAPHRLADGLGSEVGEEGSRSIPRAGQRRPQAVGQRHPPPARRAALRAAAGDPHPPAWRVEVAVGEGEQLPDPQARAVERLDRQPARRRDRSLDGPDLLEARRLDLALSLARQADLRAAGRVGDDVAPVEHQTQHAQVLAERRRLDV